MSGRMRELVRAAFVIARRDFTASVFSRTFLLFLIAPLFPVLFGGAFALMNGGGGGASHHTTRIAVVAGSHEAAGLLAARERLAAGVDDALPEMNVVAPGADPGRQITRLLDDGASAVLTPGDPAHLAGAPDDLRALSAPVALLLAEAARDRAIAAAGRAAPQPGMTLHPVRRPPPPVDHGGLASGAQSALFGLTMLLASVLLSNMTEERSNKVVEVLAAAVPVRAIFLGKLFSMLAISLVGLCVWATLAAVGVLTLTHGAGVPPPATGWGVFVPLAFLYFATNYLLFGGAFLGIGSHASSIRQVQSLGMPVAFVQLGIFSFAIAAANHPGSAMARAAALLPWSSPLTMIARAANEPALWPHLLALAWQLLWVVLTILFSAALFRRNVLKSGGGAPARPARRSARSVLEG